MVRKNILVMHTGGWIGDMILLTPALRALRKEFPKARISMLLRPLAQELMERNPYLDEIIVYDKRGAHRGIQRMRKIADKLRAKRFDTAVILHPNSVRSSVISFMARIPERVGTELKGREPFLTTKAKRRTDIHEVQRYLDVVSCIVSAGYDGELEFWGINEEDEDFADRALADHDAGRMPALPRGPVIGINPCTTWPSKQWPVERFARLADLLVRRLDARVVLTGDPGSVHLGSEIMRLMPDVGVPTSCTGTLRRAPTATREQHTAPLNLIGRTTLWQLGALIKRCALYITCDSGPMHISAAVGTPTVALFGPTDPVRHGPRGEGHAVVRKYTPCGPCYERECKTRDCMQAIRVEDVMDAVNILLD